MNFPQDVEDSILETLRQERGRQNQFASASTPQLAARVGEIHRLFPDLPNGVKIAAARAGWDNTQIEQIARRTANVNAVGPLGPISAQQQAQAQQPKKKGWWESTMDKVKTATRWTTAAMNFVPEVIQGGIAQAFDNNSSIDGWFISTELGSMMANSKESGSGFFIGGRAKELQAERARTYRGTIDGHAFTLGRGLAHLAFDPDTVPYRILSGMVDAGVQIAVPFDAGVGDALALARAAEEAGRGGELVSAIASGSRLFGRGAKEVQVTNLTADEINAIRSGVGALPTGAVDYKAANRFFGTRAGQRIIEETAKTDDFLSTWELYGKKIDVQTALELTQAKDVNAVRNILLDKLGQAEGLRNTNDMKGGSALGLLSLRARDRLLQSMDTGQGSGWELMGSKALTYARRAKAFMPKDNINLYEVVRPREQIDALETLDRVTKAYLMSPEQRREVMNKAAELMTNKSRTGIRDFYLDLDQKGIESLTKTGTPDELARQIFERHLQFRENASRYSAGIDRQPTDDGLFQRIFASDPNAAQSTLLGPMTTADLLRNEYVLPNMRELRRATNKLNWVWTKNDPNLDKLGQLRVGAAAIDSVQQYWRGIVTLTVGNFVRNIIDAQATLAASTNPGAIGLFNHPFQWLTMAYKRKGVSDIFGREISGEELSNAVSDVQREFHLMTRKESMSYYRDPADAYRSARRIGVHKDYDRVTDGVSTVAKAHGDEIGKLNADWASRSIANGLSKDDIIRMIDDGDPEAVKWLNEMKDIYGGQMPVLNRVSGQRSFVTVDLNDRANVEHLVDSFIDRVERITGGHADLKRIVGQGKLQEIAVDSRYVAKSAKVGDRVEFTDFVNGKPVKSMGNVVDIDQQTGKYIIEPFAFRNGENTEQLAQVLRSDAIYQDPKMPRYVVGEVRDPQTKDAKLVKMAFDHFVDQFHARLYENPSVAAERSPVFRNLYYEWINKLMRSMDEAGIKAAIADIEQGASKAKMLPEQFVLPSVWNKLKEFEANPSRLYGTLTREEASAYAAGAAADEFKKLLYDASERRNGVDALRMVSPFGQQWGEFLARAGRTVFSPTAAPGVYLPNFRTMRRIQLGIEGATQADPDGDGRGLVFTDPVNGQWSFSFPLSGELTKLFTSIPGGVPLLGAGGGGITSKIVAPVKGVAMGLDYRPGLGPFATVAMSMLLPDKPAFDEVRSLLLPYGEKTNIVESLIPSWAQKVWNGLNGAEGARYFAQTYAETFQALASTGQYDLSNNNDRERLFHDARRKAKVLTVLRGISQFTGPASGDFDMKVATEQGDVYASRLSNELQRMRDEDYNTATLRFIQTFGEDAFAYLSNKSKSVVGGLEASAEFGKFERSNGGFFKAYKNVAGYFGPQGTEFDFEVYTRQLRTGQREKLSPREMLAAAERVIGQSYYNEMKRQMGDKITGQEREYLSTYRDALIKSFPGFGRVDYNPNELGLNIEELFKAAKQLDNNNTATAVNYYEQIRNAALTEANRRGVESLRNNKVQDLQEWVDGYAQALIRKYPEFARVYDRLLSRELGL